MRSRATVQSPAAWAQQRGGMRYRITGDELASGLTASDLTFGFDPGDTRRYGTGAAALQRAVDASAVVIVAEAIEVDSDADALPIVVPGGRRIYGVNGASITVTGGTAVNLWMLEDAGDFGLYDLSHYGNSESTQPAGRALQVVLSDTGTADLRFFEVAGCHFENFGGDYWLAFENNNATYSLESIFIQRNTFLSRDGNARDPENIGAPSACFGIFGGPLDSATGNAKGIVIRDNVATCNFIKQFCTIWNNCVGVTIADNVIRSPGTDAQFIDDGGAYGITVYQQGSGGGSVSSRDVTVTGNKIISPRSVGVYVTHAEQIYIGGNTISGQTDQVDDTLPKGAIVIGLGVSVLIEGNICENCFAGISVVAEGASRSRFVVRNNVIRSNVAEAYGIRATVGDDEQDGEIEVSNNLIAMTGTGSVDGIICDIPGSGYSLGRLVIRGNTIETAFDGIKLDGTGSVIGYVVIEGNAVRNALNVGIDWRNSQAGHVSICNNTLQDMDGDAYGVDVGGTHNLVFAGNRFQNQEAGSGAAVHSAAARGVFEGNAFTGINVARVLASGSTDAMIDAPDWTGARGDFVQDALPAEAGAAPDKYVRMGWVYDNAAWREARAMTGN